MAGHASAVATFGSSESIPLEAPFEYRVAGLSTSGIRSSSLCAFDFGSASGVPAATPSPGLTATPASAPTGKHHKRPTTRHKLHVHDVALGSLRINVKQARKDLLAGG